ncbi:uncharacterized protein LOC111361969 [Spodoptera litura]|uniref:Uncharacterized protein LOC111361969 n=1 Tax=Spodoptera litura TaxID=69820 RepID=A0A9J7ET04_SPOLT|nr:uncharacterized protein LOC111361969 [Spodoptera litura]
MAGCRVKNVYYNCREDAWTPIESALIKLVRENPPLYTRGGRSSRTKKLMVSMMWSDISDQLGLPDTRCQEIWNRIVAEWAIVRRLNNLGYPVKNFPRANKFMNTSFTFLENYITDLKDSEIPHHIYDVYRKRFSITGSIMRASCSLPTGPTSAGKTSTTTSTGPDIKSEASAAASASGIVSTAGASGTPSKSSPQSATAVSGTTCASAQSNTPASAKSSASGEKTKTGKGLSQTSDDHGKSDSNTKAESHTKSDRKSKSGAYRSTGRKSKRK